MTQPPVTFDLCIQLRSWKETDEFGTEWWYSQEVTFSTHTGFPAPIGSVFKSRVSRMRAESYVLADKAKELHDLHMVPRWPGDKA